MKQSFPFPPPLSVNAAYKNVPGVGPIKSRAYKEWRKEAAWLLRLAKPRMITGDVSVHVEVASVYHGDLDNVLKGIMDTLQEGGVVKNDRQVRRILAEFTDRIEIGMIVHVEPLSGGRA